MFARSSKSEVFLNKSKTYLLRYLLVFSRLVCKKLHLKLKKENDFKPL